MIIRLKRAYDAPAPDDGARLLVERLWPRGVRKEALHLDAWLKDVSPSPALRAWYQHDSAKWAEFRERYLDELRANPTAVAALKSRIAAGPVTFVFAARDLERNSAAALREFLLSGAL